MPLPVFAANLRKSARPELFERQDPQERIAKLQWTEHWRLLRQKGELLMKGALPKAAPSEKELFEVVQPFLELTAALERARATESSNTWSDLQRVKQATARFHELVLHSGAGPDFVAELQEVMEGAEARLRELREQHERRSLELHQQELALTQVPNPPRRAAPPHCRSAAAPPPRGRATVPPHRRTATSLQRPDPSSPCAGAGDDGAQL